MTGTRELQGTHEQEAAPRRSADRASWSFVASAKERCGALAAFLLTATLAIAGCTQFTAPQGEPPQATQAPHTGELPAEAPARSARKPTLGALDAAYDRQKWEWVTNRDGRALLKHRVVPECYLDPEPPQDFHDAGFRLEPMEKTIGKTRYRVIHAYEGKDFWEAIYIPTPATVPVLGVYARGKCQQEAELILENYEKTQPRYVDSRP